MKTVCVGFYSDGRDMSLFWELCGTILVTGIGAIVGAEISVKLKKQIYNPPNS